MIKIDTTKPDWSALWAACELDDTPYVKQSAATFLKKYDLYLPDYLKAQRETGVPPEMFACFHMKEAGFKPDTTILNGQSIHNVTTLVPKGLGPWPTFHDALVFAARRKSLDKISKWSPGIMCAVGEKWNGMGYRDKNILSNYVAAYTNLSTERGRYIADHVWDPTAVQKSMGMMVLLKALQHAGKLKV